MFAVRLFGPNTQNGEQLSFQKQPEQSEPGFEITISIVHDYRARFSCTIFVHDRTIFSQSCTIFVPRLSCHDFHNFIDFSLECMNFINFFRVGSFDSTKNDFSAPKPVEFNSQKDFVNIKR